jgi:hypothetical protein
MLIINKENCTVINEFLFVKCVKEYTTALSLQLATTVHDRHEPHEQLVNRVTNGPKVWKVYSRRGKGGKSG